MRAVCLTVLSLVAAFTAAGAAARGHGGPQPLTFDGGQTFDQHVAWIAQQQTGPGEPHNPFGSACKWSVDDQHWTQASGYLDPGASSTETKCVVSDWPGSHPYGFSTGVLFAKSADVTLTLCFEPQGRCFTATPQWSPADRRYKSTVCARAHYNRDDPLMQEIPGSNGGTGLVTTVTTTVRNTGGQRERDVFAQAGYASDLAMFNSFQSSKGCLLTVPYVDHFEYPMEWTSS